MLNLRKVSRKPHNAKKINIGFYRVTAWSIEWADRERNNPIGLVVGCPYCHKTQWFKIDQLYIALDGTEDNLKCNYCGAGRRKKRTTIDIQISDVFVPKSTGWESIYLRAE